MAGARVRALATYKDFLTLWKDTDPDIPSLKQARAEYSKLQYLAVAGRRVLARRLIVADSCCNQAWLLKNSIFPKIAEILGIEMSRKTENVVCRAS
jgi:hypothetical protein